MKVVHFTNNTIDGAGKAVCRLHEAMLAIGLDSKMVVLEKSFEDNSIKTIKSRIRPASILRRFVSGKVKPNTLFNFNITSIAFSDVKDYVGNADIVCLHSVQSFLSPELIKELHTNTNIPFVWTLMDIEPLTGGCHFNDECAGFEKECGNCPQLRRPKENDLSRKIFKKKVKYLKDLSITFVAGSSWVADRIKRSELFKSKPIKNIFLSVDEAVYKDINKVSARKALKLAQNKKIIAFGCFNFNQKRKGAEHLLEALIKMPERFPGSKKEILKDVLLLTFGDNDGFSFSNAPFEWRHTGLLKTKQELARIYHAADVLAVPSLDDCGPMMVNEAFMCGLPIVAYRVGVSPDLIQSAQSGYIAKRFDIVDFCRGIIHCLLLEKHDVEGNQIQELKQKCTAQYQAVQYKALFGEILNGKT